MVSEWQYYVSICYHFVLVSLSVSHIFFNIYTLHICIFCATKFGLELLRVQCLSYTSLFVYSALFSHCPPLTGSDFIIYSRNVKITSNIQPHRHEHAFLLCQFNSIQFNIWMLHWYMTFVKNTEQNRIFINPYHAEFLKWNNPPSVFGTLSLSFYGISRW